MTGESYDWRRKVISSPAYSDVYRAAVREALRVELAKSAEWRRDMARKEREAIARGELLARDALWQREETR